MGVKETESKVEPAVRLQYDPWRAFFREAFRLAETSRQRKAERTAAKKAEDTNIWVVGPFIYHHLCSYTPTRTLS